MKKVITDREILLRILQNQHAMMEVQVALVADHIQQRGFGRGARININLLNERRQNTYDMVDELISHEADSIIEELNEAVKPKPLFEIMNTLTAEDYQVMFHEQDGMWHFYEPRGAISRCGYATSEAAWRAAFEIAT